MWFPSCDVCLGRHELISSLLSPKATRAAEKTEPALSQQGPRVYIKPGEEGWRQALVKTKQKAGDAHVQAGPHPGERARLACAGLLSK